MNKIKTYLIALMSLLPLLSACSREEVYYNKEEGTTTPSVPEDDYGLLQLGGLSLEIESEADSYTRAAAEVDINHFQVILTDSKDREQYNDTYEALKQLSTPLALPPGSYTLQVQSTSEIPAMAWDAPTYSGMQEVLILKRDTTTLEEMVCTLSNIKVSLELSADLKDLFQPDEEAEYPLEVTLQLGETAVVYNRTESRIAYFAAPQELNTMTVTLSGMYNTAAADEAPNYTHIEGWKQTLTNVRAGEWRKINLKVANAHSGNAQLEISVETWMYDEEVVIDVLPLERAEEEALDDPENEITHPLAPVVSLEGWNIATPFLINASIFDFDAETCSRTLRTLVTPTASTQVARVMVEIASTNKALTNLIEGAGYTKCRIPLYPENSEAEYITLRTDEATGALSLITKYAGMARIYNYEGTHTVKVVATDNSGHISYTPYTIQVKRDAVAEAGPEITWRGGTSFDERHEISFSTTLPVEIDITSTTGITTFEVGIVSTTLTPAELANIGLAERMNLIAPATDKMAETLRGFGFPVGDDVKNKTTLLFDITSFMPMLSVLGEGNTDFELTVGDAQGTTTRTIKVKAVAE